MFKSTTLQALRSIKIVENRVLVFFYWSVEKKKLQLPCLFSLLHFFLLLFYFWAISSVFLFIQRFSCPVSCCGSQHCYHNYIQASDNCQFNFQFSLCFFFLLSLLFSFGWILIPFVIFPSTFYF